MKNKLLTTTLLLISLIGSVAQAGTMIAEDDLTPHQKLIKNLIFSVCQGDWDEYRTEFTVSNTDQCSTALTQYEDVFKQRGDEPALDAIASIREELGLY